MPSRKNSLNFASISLTETDGDDDTETAGEGRTFVVGTGVSKATIKDNGAADTVFED